MKVRMIVIVVAMLSAALHAAEVRWTPHVYEAADGTKVDAQLGELDVPENRTRADSRKITLRFVRFPATSPDAGPPIVYLAGGPGGSGIEAVRGTRFALVQALREHGDVIAYDQRGTGRSNFLRCPEQFMLPLNQPLSRGSVAPMTDAVRKCAERLRAAGNDLTGYNTTESAADLEDLRKALGAKKLVLWAISYGTHLSLATLKAYPQSIDRAILAGIEAMDDTYKLPSDQQELMVEIARLSKMDLLGTIDKLLRDLEQKPRTVALVHPQAGQKADVTVGKLDLQLALADMLFGPDSFSGMPDFVTRLSQGDWTALALAAARRRMGEALSAMSVAMDCASGITAARAKKIASEAKQTLLGDTINLPFPEVCQAFAMPDLGDAFRAPAKSKVPVLLISGTLDGRTRPRQAEAVRAAGLTNAKHLIVEGAGHSDPLFLSTPKILETMKRFLRGEAIADARVAVSEPMKFIPVRKVIELPDEVLAKYVGEYPINEKSKRRVVKAGSLLYSIRDGGQPMPLRPISPTDFFVEGTATTFRFVLGPDGKPTAMTLLPVDFSAKVDAYLQPYLAQNAFSGVVLLARGDEVVLEKSYGLANAEFGVANQPDTRFAIASITKRFTAIIVRRLVDAKQLSYDDPLSKWVPSFPSADRVTINHLLRHYSGVRDPEKLRRTIRANRTAAEVVELLQGEPLGSAPGAEYSYTTANYAILAHVIERVTGESFAKVAGKYVYEPAGMKDSGELTTTAVVPRLATGYMPNPFGPGLAVCGPEDTSWKAAGGSSYATARDLLRFVRALYGGRLGVDGRTLFQHAQVLERPAFSSSGSFPGASANLLAFPDDELTVVVLSNNYATVPGTITQDLAAMSFGRDVPIPAVRTTGGGAPDPKFLGKYAVEGRPWTLAIALRDGKPVAAWNEIRQSALLRIDDEHWFSPLDWATFRFPREGEPSVAMPNMAPAKLLRR